MCTFFDCEHMTLSLVVDPTDHYTFWSGSAWGIWMCHYIYYPAVHSTPVKWSNSLIHISLCIVKHLCFCPYFRPCPKFHTIMSYTCFELKPKAAGSAKKEKVWESLSNHISECTDPFNSSLRDVEVGQSYRTNSIISFPLYCTEFHSTAQTKTLT